MQIRTFNVDTYKGNRIYFRHFGDVFEYLVIARSQIFTDNVRVKPSLIGRIQCALRLRRTAYSEDLLKKVIAILLKKAHDRVDYVLSKEWERDVKKLKKEAAS